jgi:hypothetical protein
MDFPLGAGDSNHERSRIVLDLCATLGIDPQERSAAREALGRIGGHLAHALAHVRAG